MSCKREVKDSIGIFKYNFNIYNILFVLLNSSNFFVYMKCKYQPLSIYTIFICFVRDQSEIVFNKIRSYSKSSVNTLKICLREIALLT